MRFKSVDYEKYSLIEPGPVKGHSDERAFPSTPQSLDEGLCIDSYSLPETVVFKMVDGSLISQISAATVGPGLPSSLLICHGSVGFKSSHLQMHQTEDQTAIGTEEVTVLEPVMYSSIKQQPGIESVVDAGRLNLRASWLAGRPIFGDVLLTRCRAGFEPSVECWGDG